MKSDPQKSGFSEQYGLWCIVSVIIVLKSSPDAHLYNANNAYSKLVKFMYSSMTAPFLIFPNN